MSTSLAADAAAAGAATTATTTTTTTTSIESPTPSASELHAFRSLVLRHLDHPSPELLEHVRRTLDQCPAHHRAAYLGLQARTRSEWHDRNAAQRLRQLHAMLRTAKPDRPEDHHLDADPTHQRRRRRRQEYRRAKLRSFLDRHVSPNDVGAHSFAAALAKLIEAQANHPKPRGMAEERAVWYLDDAVLVESGGQGMRFTSDAVELLVEVLGFTPMPPPSPRPVVRKSRRTDAEQPTTTAAANDAYRADVASTSHEDPFADPRTSRADTKGGDDDAVPPERHEDDDKTAHDAVVDETDSHWDGTPTLRPYLFAAHLANPELVSLSRLFPSHLFRSSSAAAAARRWRPYFRIDRQPGGERFFAAGGRDEEELLGGGGGSARGGTAGGPALGLRLGLGETYDEGQDASLRFASLAASRHHQLQRPGDATGGEATRVPSAAAVLGSAPHPADEEEEEEEDDGPRRIALPTGFLERSGLERDVGWKGGLVERIVGWFKGWWVGV